MWLGRLSKAGSIIQTGALKIFIRHEEHEESIFIPSVAIIF